jgi:DNA-binding CsgD family transcriptional regulator
MQQELSLVAGEYADMLNHQSFDEASLDYSLLDIHIPFLTQLSQTGNSGITVFDLFKKQHVFASYNFSTLFGFDMEELKQNGNEYFDSRIHPEDYIQILKLGISMFRFCFQLSPAEKKDYKMINEYRMRNAEDKYLRVIEQHQLLELDVKGNIWLALGIIDISPNQEEYSGVRSQILNFKTGRIVNLEKQDSQIRLTKREKEILSLIKDGYMSKEISEKLSISLHTVNTHRQRILEKMNADNSLEAVKYASRLGLVE